MTESLHNIHYQTIWMRAIAHYVQGPWTYSTLLHVMV